MGIKVLLSGIGGDEVFAGYRRHVLAKYSFLLDIIPIQILAKLNHWMILMFQKLISVKMIWPADVAF